MKLKSMTLEEMGVLFNELGQPAFRAKQVYTWLHKGVRSYDEMTNLPKDLRAVLDQIHALGAKTGVSVKPGTPVETLYPYLDKIDMVLIMTVEPGFGGQKFMADMVGKIEALRAHGYEGLIEVDGGVDASNIDLLAKAGMNVAVMGTALYKNEDPAALIDRCHDL